MSGSGAGGSKRRAPRPGGVRGEAAAGVGGRAASDEGLAWLARWSAGSGGGFEVAKERWFVFWCCAPGEAELLAARRLREARATEGLGRASAAWLSVALPAPVRRLRGALLAAVWIAPEGGPPLQAILEQAIVPGRRRR